MTCKDDDKSTGFTENPYFDRKEFACKCGCGYAVVDARLLELLTIFRIYLDTPIFITSGARCYAYNKTVGGAHPKLDADHNPIWGTGSQHLWGLAADIVVVGVPPHDVYELMDESMKGSCGLGEYREFVHFDVRQNGPARWRGDGVINYIKDKNGEDLA